MRQAAAMYYGMIDFIDERVDALLDAKLTNLAGDPAHGDVAGALRLRLLDWCLETESARPVPLHYPPFEGTGDAS